MPTSPLCMRGLTGMVKKNMRCAPWQCDMHTLRRVKLSRRCRQSAPTQRNADKCIELAAVLQMLIADIINLQAHAAAAKCPCAWTMRYACPPVGRCSLLKSAKLDHPTKSRQPSTCSFQQLCRKNQLRVTSHLRQVFNKTSQPNGSNRGGSSGHRFRCPCYSCQCTPSSDTQKTNVRNREALYRL